MMMTCLYAMTHFTVIVNLTVFDFALYVLFPAAVTLTLIGYLPFFRPFLTVIFPALDTMIFLDPAVFLYVTLPFAFFTVNAFFAATETFFFLRVLNDTVTFFTATVIGLAFLVTAVLVSEEVVLLLLLVSSAVGVTFYD